MFFLPVGIVPDVLQTLNWCQTKLKCQRKQQQAAAKAQLKAGKKSKCPKDAARTHLEGRASHQVPEYEHEARLTRGMLWAQEQAARRDQQLIQEMLGRLGSVNGKESPELLSPAWGSSSSLQELGELQQQECWAPGKEAMRQQVTAQEMLQKMPCLQPLSSSHSPWGSSSSPLEEAAKGWWEKKIKKEKKQKKAEAKAKLKAEKKAKRAQKDSKNADLEEQRASRQVPGEEKEPRMTWGMLRAQKEAARGEQQPITKMPDEVDQAMESSHQEVRSPDRAGSSTTLRELDEQQRKESWAPGNEAMREKMTAQEMLEPMPRPTQLSSSDSLCRSDQEALEQKPAKARSQEPTAVQQMSAASSPSSKRPLQSPELREEPGKEESQASSQWKEPGREKSGSPAMSQRSKPGKEQSQASRKQQQPGAATPQARKQKAQKPRSSPGKKLRKCLAQIWFCLKCCFCSCFCPCLLHQAQKRNRLP